MRSVKLGTETCYLEGDAPSTGSLLNNSFLIPEATGNSAVADLNLKKSLVIVSTLPNIKKEHCVKQILDLEILSKKILPNSIKIFHFSSDHKDDWKNIQSDLRLPIKGYTLHDATAASKLEFKNAFGVGVVGNERIAHGLFALFKGQFIVVHIPNKQIGTPNIPYFINEILNVKF